jgi:hypothetical protein
VPVIVTSEAVNVAGVIALPNTTVKFTGPAFVGSACATAWLIVTVGATLSKVIVLSELVLAVLLFVAKSWTLLAAIAAMIVPFPVTVTGTFQVMLSLVVGDWTVTPVAVPPIVMSVAVKVEGLIALPNTTVKFTGPVFVGSACATAWLIVTVGAKLSKVIVLSELALAVLLFVAKSWTLLAAIVAMIVPLPATVTGTFQVMLSLVVGDWTVTPVAVPPIVMSVAVKVEGLIALPNTTVKFTGPVFVGSACATAWLIVTVGATLSKVIVLSELVLAVLLFVAGSWTLLAAIAAMIVPGPVTLTGTFQVMLSLVVGDWTVTPVAVPPIVMSAAVKVEGLIAVVKTTVKFTGLTFVGSTWAAAWLIVTPNPTLLNVIVLSVLVLTVLLFVAGSWTLLAAIVAMIVPGLVTLTGTFQVMLSLVVGDWTVTPVAVPPIVMSVAVKVEGLIAVVKTTVKFTGLTFVGSTWATAWLIVTPNPTLLNVIVLSVLVLTVLLFVAKSWTLLAAIVAMIVPGPVTLTGTFQVMLSLVVGA